MKKSSVEELLRLSKVVYVAVPLSPMDDEALTYLKDHFPEEFNADELVNALKCSKTALYVSLRRLSDDGLICVCGSRPKLFKAKKGS